jgi:hypothetical protein
MLDRGRPLSLCGCWWNAIQLLRPAFSRLSTFMWFATVVAGITVRVDTLGVTSIVRALNLRPKLYHRLLAHFHSTGVKLDRLAALWVQVVLHLFPSPLLRQWPAGPGRGWHQDSQARQKDAGRQAVASEIGIQHQARLHHGALLAAVSLLVNAAQSVFAVPLAARIHEGLVWSNRDKRTLLDKMLGLLGILTIGMPLYFVADAYYAAGKVVKGLLEQGHHLV